MSVKVMIKRKVPDYKVKELMPLLMEMRNLAMKQPAYISGETLNRVDKAGEQLVISTWRTLEAWREWVLSKERRELQDKIDLLLGEVTEYEVYSY